MRPLTDKQRTELALIPAMLQGIIQAGAFPKDQSTKLAFLARVAAQGPLEDLQTGKRNQLHRRITRLALAASVILDQQSRVKIGMVLYYFTQDLLEREVLELAEGSPCAEVLQAMIEMIEGAEGFAQDRLDRAAQKQARKLLQLVQREGYFHGGAPLSEAA